MLTPTRGANYRAGNRERLRLEAAQYRRYNPDVGARYRATHKAGLKKSQRKWYIANAEKRKAYSAWYRTQHPGKASAVSARWRAEHAEEARERSRQRYAADRKGQVARARKWREENPDTLKATLARYRANHPEEMRVRAQAARARKSSASGTYTFDEWTACLALWDNCCAYCGRKMKGLTQDHVVPLSKGGWHCGLNVVPACKPCNSQKGVSMLREWLTMEGE